jgi:hypothetical protein
MPALTNPKSTIRRLFRCSRQTCRHPSPPRTSAFAQSAGNSENFDSCCENTAMNGPPAQARGQSPRRLSRPAAVAPQIR